MGAAAWGSFLSNGYYAGQPALGRRALVGSLMLGCLVVVGLAIALLESVAPREDSTWSRYQITKGGEIYKITQLAGKPVEITDLSGLPVKDAKTGHPLTQSEINRLSASAYSVQPQFEPSANTQKPLAGRLSADIPLFHLVAANARFPLVLDLEWPATGL